MRTWWVASLWISSPDVDPLQLSFVDIPLTKASPKRKGEKGAEFLRTNPLAKVVVLVDTHSAQDGSLVIGTDRGGNVYSDFLGPVSDRY